MSKVNVSVPTTLWRAFRVACLERGISASKVIGQLIETQLKVWAVAGSLQKGTDDHAQS